ncbi:hypothetical protein [Gloeocapsa sp. PCC 7428]|uniref:hypothetical protein n=1 Tax=Gloeocapsa sp. PCC 7428 TaxID=1173026 RepID=UPI000311ED3F|nr:hypothetical protein [Gloeocapsa sp. PCC 7428]
MAILDLLERDRRIPPVITQLDYLDSMLEPKARSLYPVALIVPILLLSESQELLQVQQPPF